MPATSSESKALTGIKTSIEFKVETGNKDGGFGTITALPAAVSPRWFGLVQTFNYSPTSEVQTSYSMGALDGTQRADPVDQQQGKRLVDWTMKLQPQADSVAASPYYSHQYLFAAAHSDLLKVGSATAADNYASGATNTTTEQHYISINQVLMESEATTNGGRSLVFTGAKIADYEISCSIGGMVEVNISGPALTVSTAHSDNFGSFAHSSHATTVTTQGIWWNDTKVEIAGVVKTNVKSWSYKKTKGMAVNHRITSDATGMIDGWAITEGRNTFEVKVTFDFESYEELNALLNGTKQDVIFELTDGNYIAARNVMWTTAPVDASLDQDELISFDVTGRAETSAFVGN